MERPSVMLPILFFGFIVFLEALIFFNIPHTVAENITNYSDLQSGWSMISLPVSPENCSVSALFPNAVVVYGYQQGIGYIRISEGECLEIGKGYWILINASKVYPLTGEPFHSYTLSGEDGWAMIGGCSSSSKATVEYGDIVVIYEYAKKVGYKRLLESGNLEPGKGYWILLSNIDNQTKLKVNSSSIPIVCTDIDKDGFALEGDTCGAVDCEDADQNVNPDATEICNGMDDNCNGEIDENFDIDADGFTSCDGDCNDSDANIYPDGNEICGNGIDEDCDGSDLSCNEVDNDGDRYTENQGDCDDTDSDIHPGAVEICDDGTDQNCNGLDFDCLSKIQVTPNEVLINTPTTITISSEISADTSISIAIVQAFKTDAEGKLLSLLCTLYDDGMNGDAIAGDNLFTGQFDINESKPLIFNLRVSAAYSSVRNTSLSETLGIDVYKIFTQEEISEIFNSGDTFNKNFNSYITQYDEETAQNKILLEALANNKIENAELKGDTLSILFKSGILGILNLNTSEEITLGGPGNNKVGGFFPAFSGPIDNLAQEETIAEFLLNGIFDSMHWSLESHDLRFNNGASLEAVKNWNKYGTVIIHSHGFVVPRWFWKEDQIAILTGTSIGSEEAQEFLHKDVSLHNCGLYVAEGSTHYAILPSFIDTHIEDNSMQDTFFYLGACSSLYNDSLWNVLKKKGAKVAFGWSKTTRLGYDTLLFERLMRLMLPSACKRAPLSAKEAFDNLMNKMLLPCDEIHIRFRHFCTQSPVGEESFFVPVRDESNRLEYKATPSDDKGLFFRMRVASSEWNNFKFITDPDNDGIGGICDNCPNDPNKIDNGICGCGVTDVDFDNDLAADCIDNCSNEKEDVDGFEDSDGCPDPDNDGDGILDTDDNCPDVAEDIDGFEDSDGCPDMDNDGDGIEDKNDNCQNEKEDIDGYKDSDGCPDPDNDGDGILDTDDNCPDAAEDIDDYEDSDGCPDMDNDRDGDGILDMDDNCPDAAEDIDDYEDSDGCPDPDNDGDGIADENDNCPNKSNPTTSFSFFNAIYCGK